MGRVCSKGCEYYWRQTLPGALVGAWEEFDQNQAEFACRISVSQSYLAAVEHGRNEVGAEILLAISREFGKSLEWLLTGEE